MNDLKMVMAEQPDKVVSHDEAPRLLPLTLGKSDGATVLLSHDAFVKLTAVVIQPSQV